jgi:Rad3-related DNA helicase
MELRARLMASGRPSRLLVLTPSHALADEVAAAWRAEGVSVAVLRGYEATEPGTKAPMCCDIPAVKAAIEARLEVHETACAGHGHSCRFFASCLKQRNRAEVATADIVVAAHHALFTGFAVETGAIAAIVIDEGLWSSAVREPTGIGIDALAHELLGHALGLRGGDEAAADLHELR